MVHSQWPEPEPGQTLETKGLHNFHITFLQGWDLLSSTVFIPVQFPVPVSVRIHQKCFRLRVTRHIAISPILFIYHIKEEKNPKIYLLVCHMNNSSKFGIFDQYLKQCVVRLTLYTLLHSHVFRAGESKVWCVVSLSTDQCARTDHPQHL